MTLAPQVRDVAAAVDPAVRLVNLRRANEANNDVLWVMTLWMRITVVLSSVALGASRQRVVLATFRRPLFQAALGIVVGTVIIFTGAVLFRTTELPGAENDLTFQGMVMIIGYGMVMLGVCMLGCVVPTRRALNIEPTIALRTE